MRNRTSGVAGAIPSGWGVFGMNSGGVAALNHRLIAAMPNRGDASGIGSVAFNDLGSPRDFTKPVTPGRFSLGIPSDPQDPIFFLPTENSEEPRV